MSEKEIQRVDEIPLIIYWLLKMRVHEIIDRILPHPHLNRQGLSYGQLALLFVAYVIHLRTHRLSGMEEWVQKHRLVLEEATGWTIGPKEAADDRLGDLLSVMGEDEERRLTLQQEMGQHLIQAYALPTQLARFDTTTFNVHHAPSEEGTSGGGLLTFGLSKDQRPDLLQFKQGLGTLDPAGVPLLTATLPGKRADDPLYIPAWRQMVHIIGHRHFLFVADCKAAALATRGTLDAEGGGYLFPLPMTGEVPDLLRTWVLEPPVKPEPLVLPGRMDDEQKERVVGQGFEVEREMSATLEDGRVHRWSERWLVTRSDALAERQQEALHRRLQKAEKELATLQAKCHEDAAALQAQAEALLRRHQVTPFIQVQVEETVTCQKRYIGPGRPGPHRPWEMEEVRRAHLTYQRCPAAIEEALHLAGWRIHVTNAPRQVLPLGQAIAHYRGMWRNERDYHRFKKGSLPALPLFVRLPERIVGLMLLLMIALQALTLLEFVAQQALAEQGEELAGLVPGNPKMKTAHPSAERLLARFDNLHLLVERIEEGLEGELVEPLTPLQRRILVLLRVPEHVYDLSFLRPPLSNSYDSS
jgi:transposase